MTSVAKPLVLIGAGGHAKVAIDVACRSGRSVAGLLTRKCSAEEAALGVAVLGDDGRLDDPAFVAAHDFFVAIGDGALRRRLAGQLAERGAVLTSLVDPGAILGSAVDIGEGTVVMPGVVVNASTRVGRFVILNTSCSVDHDCLLRDGCHICPGAHLAGGVVCGEDVVIGIGAAVAPSVTIGNGAVIGAGSAVIADIPAGLTVVGCPARPLK